MRGSGDGTVDVAVRRCRAWSAPAAPLSHICGSHSGAPASGSAGAPVDTHTTRALPVAIYRLFPTRTVFTVVDIPFTPAPAPECNGARHTPVSSRDETDRHNALHDELEAAKNQICLLSTASAQSFQSYSALEAENAELRDANRRLREMNEELKSRLAQRNEEVKEQLQHIGDLELKLKELSGYGAAVHHTEGKAVNGSAR
ncbi:hypothetical protein NESM_000857000 [Novymonas esmeraldas]|uniref:Uncharacterized protein n=1 Tax=Novymonas esmeraldas TaxID=1808958 RepID=A0AAW0F006_9TRYP